MERRFPPPNTAGITADGFEELDARPGLFWKSRSTGLRPNLAHIQAQQNFHDGPFNLEKLIT
jgi:hypothetical protein